MLTLNFVSSACSNEYSFLTLLREKKIPCVFTAFEYGFLYEVLEKRRLKLNEVLWEMFIELCLHRDASIYTPLNADGELYWLTNCIWCSIRYLKSRLDLNDTYGGNMRIKEAPKSNWNTSICSSCSSEIRLRKLGPRNHDSFESNQRMETMKAECVIRY